MIKRYVIWQRKTNCPIKHSIRENKGMTEIRAQIYRCLLPIVLLASMTGCFETEKILLQCEAPVEIRRVDPSVVVSGSKVALSIRGDGFICGEFDDPSVSVEVEACPVEGVALIDDRSINVVLLAGCPEGTHYVKVVREDGATGQLEDALIVVPIQPDTDTEEPYSTRSQIDPN